MTTPIVFNGIDGDTGAYARPPVDAAELVAEIAAAHDAIAATQAANLAAAAGGGPRLGVASWVDRTKLDEAGWGLVLPPHPDPEVLEALEPLRDHRRSQAGNLYAELTWRQGESRAAFLGRLGAEVGGPVDPSKGVPYYLLIVGSPTGVSFDFQAGLDLVHAVGRLDLESAEDYERYARAVVDSERPAVDGEGGVAKPRRAVFWGTAHPGDQATEGAAAHFLAPVAQWFAQKVPTWSTSTDTGARATKARLLEVLSGDAPPSLLFTTGHGASFSPASLRQRAWNGALVCQDRGPRAEWGPLAWGDVLAAHDLDDDARVGGLVAFHFACYGGGTPAVRPLSGERAAPEPFTAALPRRMLSHPKGPALAVIAHVDEVFGYSFYSALAGPQLAAFKSLLHELARGVPVGAAMEPFDGRFGSVSADLSALLTDRHFGRPVDEKALVAAWTAQEDIKNYLVLGDPAARSRA